MSWKTIALSLWALGAASILVTSNQHKPLPAAQPKEAAWVNLFPGANLQGWKRVPILPDTKLSPKNPWKVNKDSKVLECDGVGIKEMLLQETERGDGVFHIEWRFRKVPEKMDYNSGIYVRTGMDGKVWHQCQVAHLPKPPLLGDLFGETRVGGEIKKFLAEGQGAKLAQPPGEWNTYDITCKGTQITVAVNGKTATTWNDCQVARGHVGMQAEFFLIEFREMKFKVVN